MDFYLQEIRKKCLIGLVGGSDIVKIAEQIGGTAGCSPAPFLFIFILSCSFQRSVNTILSLRKMVLWLTKMAYSFSKGSVKFDFIVNLFDFSIEHSKVCWRRKFANFYQLLSQIHVRIDFTVQTVSFLLLSISR